MRDVHRKRCQVHEATLPKWQAARAESCRNVATGDRWIYSCVEENNNEGYIFRMGQ